jgi:membrane-associated protease RseP (regulator of RpoE activity)
MRLWPFSSTAHELNGAPPERFTVIEDLLRRNVEDVFRVERQEVRGATFGWGGALRVEPARALALLEARFKPFGYTPFLGRQGDLVWIRAVPLANTRVRLRPGLNLSLFLLTVLSTIAAGGLPLGHVPFLEYNPLAHFRLAAGVQFSVTLLAILATHEFGHYFTARYYGGAVSLPYFIPLPPPFIFGTLGAIIVMRSPARDRNALFDIAVAGPLAGLVVAIPALLLGLQWSRVGLALPAGAGVTIFGDSLLMRLSEWIVFGRLPGGMDVFVHPVALAGWVGLYVTALNLFPVGQLDGGRIAYALFGPRHRLISIATIVGLLLLATLFWSPSWIFFVTLILLLMGIHHAPPLDDLTPLSRRRYALGLFCLVLLVLLVPPVPIR